MKWKIIGALLLAVVFGLLASEGGAFPAAAAPESMRSEASAAPSAGPGETPEPIQTAAPPDASPSGEPSGEATPEPPGEKTAEPSAAPGGETTSETSEPSGESPQVIPTTIVSEDPLDNDSEFEVDADELLSQTLTQTLPAEGPQILIVHTHATEAYTMDGGDCYEPTDPYRTTDVRYSVVRVGEELKTELEACGLRVLHDTNLYDYPSYNGSYTRCGAAVEEALAEYPSLALVIDLHRDALGGDGTIYKTVTQTDEGPAAQLMLVMGTDQNLWHPNWRENLALALQLQNAAQTAVPGLMRPLELCEYRYNQQLTTGSLLLEVGTSGNTLQEAITAVRLFARAVGPFLAALSE